MTEHPVSIRAERQVPASEIFANLPSLRLPAGDIPTRQPGTLPATVEPAGRLLQVSNATPTTIAGNSDHPKRRPLRRLLLIGAGLLALSGASYFAWQYWTVGRFQIATDDAYVQADNTVIAPKVSGYLTQVLIGDNQEVKAGQLLARIDDRDFLIALAQANADVAAAEATVANKRAALDVQQAAIAAARAVIVVDEANELYARQEDERYATLAAKGFGSVQNAQQAASRIAAAHATVARDKAALENATRQLEVLKAELSQALAALARAHAAQDQAELNLSYTRIVSPIDGVIGNRTLRVGQYVQAGTQLMAVVPIQSAYIVANYKETQLTDVRPGQPVVIEVDTFPGQAFRGRVDSLSPASGQEFALLPPDNATGNFTKVVQRIPVKIILDPDNPFALLLRPGMSVYPSIDTRVETPKLAAAAPSKV
jgi:membrane fusion protein (multidrug efflux system)